jgi:hypothetical protein
MLIILRDLLAIKPDLRVIVMSATIQVCVRTADAVFSGISLFNSLLLSPVRATRAYTHACAERPMVLLVSVGNCGSVGGPFS